ncbi:MAG: U32 family peptidase, partial [Clostridia bacterium]|nr:U32 family peptidase [Clostridia bacterium]
MSKLELLSPAGSIDAIYQAVHGGADSVYMGGANFGARAFAANFTYEQMKTAIYFCHLYNVKVYITVNTLIYEDEIEQFISHVKKIYELGADALIIQDIGMMETARQTFPDIEIHASTQMHNHNDASLDFVQSLGACRAVLAREMS